MWLARGEIASGHAVPTKCSVQSACLLDPLSTKAALPSPRTAQHMPRADEGTLELQDWPLQGCRGMGGAGEWMWGVHGWAPGQLECLQ